MELTELCQEIHNWFVRDIYRGTFRCISQEQNSIAGIAVVGVAICNGERISTSQLLADVLQNGQYYRIKGSVFNDGVYKYPDDDLTPETFTGEVWSLGIPRPVIRLAQDIDAWVEKYGGVDSEAMSPYTSESFGGYSYSKGTSAMSVSGKDIATGWKAVFASQLNRWRKI